MLCATFPSIAMSELLHRPRPNAGIAARCGLIWLAALTINTAAFGRQPAPAAPGDEAPSVTIAAGQSLDAALRQYQRAGLELVFTSATVRPDLRVLEVPTSGSLREQVDQLLATHDLTLRSGPRDRWIVVPAPAHAIAVRVETAGGAPIAGARLRLPAGGWLRTDADGRATLNEATAATAIEVEAVGFEPRRLDLGPDAGRPAPLCITLDALPEVSEAIEALAVRPRRLGETLSTITIEGPAVETLPLLGDDVIRGLEQVAGTASNERSARFSIRGGRSDETLVLLDGVELFEPFHLQDFGATVSVLPPGLLGAVDLVTGGFPADYGDRMAGVLTLTTREPPMARRSQLAVTLWDVQAATSGRFTERLGYQASVRRGSLDPAYDLGDLETDPTFWDALGKLTWSPSPRHDLRLEMLAADDSFGQDTMRDGDLESVHSRFDSTYAWLDHQAVIGRRLSSQSTVSFSRIERQRSARVEDARGALALDDARRLDVTGVAQRFGLQLGTSGELRAGVELRFLEAIYDQRGRNQLAAPLASGIGAPRPVVDSAFASSFIGSLVSGFISTRLEPVGGLVLEIGARFDENSITDDHLLSPRASVAWKVGAATSLRAAWGDFFQTHRLYELEVSDGERDFQSAERARRSVIGIDHRLRGRTSLRAEIYHRRINHPRVRFENLFDPFSFSPELEPDRVRVEAASSRAYGLELTAEGGGRRLGWTTSYALSRIEDRIAGRFVPRSIDQTHALRADLDVVLGRFSLDVGWQLHTGWPITAATAVVRQDGDGAVAVPVLGPLLGERLPEYHRLDVRLSRRFELPIGGLEAFAEVQNLYDRHNLRGFDLDFAVAEDGVTPIVLRQAEAWGGIFPRLGIRWTF